MQKRARKALVWAIETFGKGVANNPHERTLRFIEEAVELAHSLGVNASTVQAITDRVYQREQGLIVREIGQAQLTLELLAECIGQDADKLAAAEFERIQTIPQSEWQRRHQAKVEIGIAQ